MSKYEYRVIRIMPQRAEEALNDLGSKGFAVVDATAVDNKIVYVLEREKAAGRPKKKDVKKKA